MRFHGAVGYDDVDVETAPGVWQPSMVEKTYSGDVIRSASRLVPVPEANQDITLENSFSIVADGFAIENFSKMRYVNWNGANWTITSVEVRRPRLILTIGGLWLGRVAH